MSKDNKTPGAKKPQAKTPKTPGGTHDKTPRNPDDLYDDGDIATPKRDFNEDEIKEEEDKRM